MTKKKKKSKVVCKECLFFNQENRCDLRKTISALAPGRKRRCHQFSPRFVKREDLIKRPREVLPEQIADVLIPLKEKELETKITAPKEEKLDIPKAIADVAKKEVLSEKEILPEKEEIPEKNIPEETLESALTARESLPKVTLLEDKDIENILEETNILAESIPETTRDISIKEDVPESEKKEVPKKESFFKRLFRKK